MKPTYNGKNCRISCDISHTTGGSQFTCDVQEHRGTCFVLPVLLVDGLDMVVASISCGCGQYHELIVQRYGSVEEYSKLATYPQ